MLLSLKTALQRALLLAALASLLFFSPRPGGAGCLPLRPAGAGAEEEILRFHVRADSNSIPDQQAKNAVAAAILQHFAPAWHACTEREELEQILARDLEKMAEKARAVLQERGMEEDVAVTLGRSTFPARLYGGRYYPPGEYASLVLVIGTGRGENWWCVIFPPLCFNLFPAPGEILPGGGRAAERAGSAPGTDSGPACREQPEQKNGGEKKWRFWLAEYFVSP